MSKNASLEQVQEAAERQGALASLTLADRDWILANVLLHSLEDDLATAYHRGWWRRDPSEMLSHPPRYERIVSCRARPLQAAQLARELNSPQIERLYHIIRACTQGRVATGRGVVVRNARKKGAEHVLYVRRKAVKSEPEGLAA